MTIFHIIERPPVSEAVVWDGNNFSEVQAFISSGTTVVDNGNGTLTFDDGMSQFTVQQGDCLTRSGYGGPLTQHQVVKGAGPYEYKIRSSS